MRVWGGDRGGGEWGVVVVGRSVGVGGSVVGGWVGGCGCARVSRHLFVCGVGSSEFYVIGDATGEQRGFLSAKKNHT